MNVFADTSYFIALANPTDDGHDAAVRFASQFRGGLMTTQWVLVELGNSLSSRANRSLFVGMHDSMIRDPASEIIPADQDSFEAGLALFRQRMDKAWSLTDCISFTVMQSRGIRRVATTDHHFAQCGFEVVL